MLKRIRMSLVMNKILLIALLAEGLKASGFNDCLSVDKNDSRIRIGFLSRYKTSKVSDCKKKAWLMRFSRKKPNSANI